jgi:ABC-type xylose transport system permease subunit
VKIARGILGVVVGLIVAFAIVQAAEMLTHHLYPFPPGADMKDMATIKKLVATLPVPAFVLVLTGWLVGTLLGTFAAAKIGRSRIPAYILGALLLCAGIANAVIIPQPLWFSALSFAIFIAVPFVGVALAKPPAPETV